MAANKPTIYLRNKDLLVEIKKSKDTFSSYVDERYSKYAAIVSSFDQVTLSFVEEVRAKLQQDTNLVAAKTGTETNTIQLEDVVIRVMTYDHIPKLEEPPLKKDLREKHLHAPCGFPPYQHVILKDGALVCVGKSHWIGGMENGYFSPSHGKLTDTLGRMFLLLVKRYATRPNWSGYSYLDEMMAQSIEQLTRNGLMFDESKSDQPNPFGYYTSVVANSFRKILHIEKRNQALRDDLLIQNGRAPSLARQLDNELNQPVTPTP